MSMGWKYGVAGTTLLYCNITKVYLKHPVEVPIVLQQVLSFPIEGPGAAITGPRKWVFFISCYYIKASNTAARMTDLEKFQEL